MKIVNEKQNKLLNRKEVVVALEFQGKTTPSNADLIKQVAGAVKAKEEAIHVDCIKQAYGDAVATATVYVYDTKENLDKIHYYKKKKVLKQIREKDSADRKAAKEGAAKPAEAPAEAPAAPTTEAPVEVPAEQPAEVKAEEKPVEVKAEETTNEQETKTEE